MQIPFTQVDAFADAPLTGNPAAVMPLDAWLSDATLQAIANENNVSETAFYIPWAGEDADFALRWFTPTVEVALCGHATLASGHVVLDADPARTEVRFMTRKAGMLAVSRAAQGYHMALPAYAPSPSVDRSVADALGGAAIETLSHARGYSVVTYASEADIHALYPDFATLKTMGDTLFIATAPGDTTDVVSRVFAPTAGIDEDPVTGSAHAVITPYWAARLGRARFTAYQASARGGRLTCEAAGERVYLEGDCVTVIEGVFRL